MAKIFGIKPQAATQQLIEKFENEVVIRHHNQMLVGTVYVDMQNSQWAVAMAYNLSRHPGLHGRENALEVRYSYSQDHEKTMRMFRSDPVQDTFLEAGPFKDPETFIRYAISHERTLVNRPA